MNGVQMNHPDFGDIVERRITNELLGRQAKINEDFAVSAVRKGYRLSDLEVVFTAPEFEERDGAYIVRLKPSVRIKDGAVPEDLA